MLKVTKRVQRAGGEGTFLVMAKAQELLCQWSFSKPFVYL